MPAYVLVTLGQQTADQAYQQRTGDTETQHQADDADHQQQAGVGPGKRVLSHDDHPTRCHTPVAIAIVG